MRLFGRNIAGFAKVVVILVAVLLVSSGLCGMELILAPASHGGGLPTAWATAGLVSLAAILLSAAALVVVLPLWAVIALVQRSTKGPAGNEQRVATPIDQLDKFNQSNQGNETRTDRHDEKES